LARAEAMTLSLSWAPRLSRTSGATDCRLYYLHPNQEAAILWPTSAVVEGGETSLSVEHGSSHIWQLDQEIETLRETLHRLVSANPSQLRSTEVYRLSKKLDRLIHKLHKIKTLHL
jgi:hypothetical protein